MSLYSHIHTLLVLLTGPPELELLPCGYFSACFLVSLNDMSGHHDRSALL